MIFIQENLTGSELFEYIIRKRVLEEREALEILAQILSAVSHLHENNIAHRDLKPENILLMSENSKILKISNLEICTFTRPGAKFTQKLGTVRFT